MAEVFTPDNLFAGKVQPVVSGAATITGASLTRGTVLGRITSGGSMKAVDSAQTDGSEEPYAVLAEDVDASGEDKEAVVYYTGEFNENALTFGGTDTADTHRAAARKIGIFFKDAVSA